MTSEQRCSNHCNPYTFDHHRVDVVDNAESFLRGPCDRIHQSNDQKVRIIWLKLTCITLVHTSETETNPTCITFSANIAFA